MPPALPWYLDLQASDHIVGDASWITDLRPTSTPIPDPSSPTTTSVLHPSHSGTAVLLSLSSGRTATLEHALLVPGYPENRLSLPKLLSLGFELHMSKQGASLEREGKEWFWADPMGLGLTRWKVDVVKRASLAGGRDEGGSGEGAVPASQTTVSAPAKAKDAAPVAPVSADPTELATSSNIPSAAATREPALPTPASSNANTPSTSTTSLGYGVPDVIYADAIPLIASRPQRIRHLVTGLSTGLSLSVNDGPGAFAALNCGRCDQSFKPNAVGVTDDTTGPISIVHLELRKMHTVAAGGEQYVFLLVDDFTRFTWIYHVQKPHNILKIFTRWNKERRAEGFDKPTKVYAGPGMVVIADDFAYHLRLNFDIGYICRGPHSDFDHASDTLLALCTNTIEMMLDRMIPLDLWTDVLRASVYLHNVTPTPRRDAPSILPSSYPNPPPPRDYATPTELLYGKLPDLAHLRVIGSLAWGPVHGADPKELVRGTLVGYGPQRTGGETYRLWDKEQGLRIVLASRVVVDETKMVPTTNIAPSRGVLERMFGLKEAVLDEGGRPPTLGPCAGGLKWEPRAIPDAWESMSGAWPYGRTRLGESPVAWSAAGAQGKITSAGRASP